MHLCIEARQLANSNGRGAWIRGDANIADVLTRMHDLVNPAHHEDARQELHRIYKQKYGYYSGDLEQFQKQLIAHREAEVTRISELRGSVTKLEQMSIFHKETVWKGSSSDAVLPSGNPYKWTSDSSINVIELKLRLDLDITIVSYASFTVLRPNVVKHL